MAFGKIDYITKMQSPACFFTLSTPQTKSALSARSLSLSSHAVKRSLKNDAVSARRNEEKWTTAVKDTVRKGKKIKGTRAKKQMFKSRVNIFAIIKSSETEEESE